MTDELHAELEALRDAIDRVEATGQGREELVDLIHAVERKLEDPEDEDHHQHLNDRLNETVTKYEVEHPEVTSVLRRLIDTLASAGI